MSETKQGFRGNSRKVLIGSLLASLLLFGGALLALSACRGPSFG